LNGGTAETDRRFFNAPDIVRTRDGILFDAVLIGSGDRTNPKAADVKDQFYMIRDKGVAPYFTAKPTKDATRCQDPTEDFRYCLPLDVNELYDVTDNLIETGSTDEIKVAEAKKLADANGWSLDLANGEKSLSRSVTIQGTVYFGTFSPVVNSSNICEPIKGTGRLYIVNMLNSRTVRDFNGDDKFERSWIVGSLIPDTPSVYVDPDTGEISLLLPPGTSGDGFLGNPFYTGASMPDPYGSYWYREEY
jgi:type IV pilus assembly protein PilY1